MPRIRLIITDFDGTLVDTFRANCLAYQDAFQSVGKSLSEEEYKACFGLRFDDFMRQMGITDTETARQIRARKSEIYPRYFGHLAVNRPLLDFIRSMRCQNVLTAIASTARRGNLLNALSHIGAQADFDLILAGEDVVRGKPSPQIYQTVMAHFGVTPEQTLIFEDSPSGCQAADAAQAGYMIIKQIQTQ